MDVAASVLLVPSARSGSVSEKYPETCHTDKQTDHAVSHKILPLVLIEELGVLHAVLPTLLG